MIEEVWLLVSLCASLINFCMDYCAVNSATNADEVHALQRKEMIRLQGEINVQMNKLINQGPTS